MEARLIKIEELVTLGCDLDTWNCATAPEVYSTSYWTATAYDSQTIWIMFSDTDLGNDRVTNNNYFGVRPIINVSKTQF